MGMTVTEKRTSCSVYLWATAESANSKKLMQVHKKTLGELERSKQLSTKHFHLQCVCLEIEEVSTQREKGESMTKKV